MSQTERMECIALIAEAVQAGARIEQACEILDLSPVTLRRWEDNPDGKDERDGPLNALASRSHGRGEGDDRGSCQLSPIPRQVALADRPGACRRGSVHCLGEHVLPGACGPWAC